MNTTSEIDLLSRNVSLDANPGPRCELISSFVELERLAPEWNRLWRCDPEAEVFQTFAWNRAWWRANAHNFELYAPVVWDGDQVLGILPMARKGSTVRFLGTPEADYADVICEERNAVLCLTIAIRKILEFKGWSECVLEHLSSNSRFVRHWKELPDDIRGRMAITPAGSCPTVLLGSEPGLLKKLADKKHLRRHETKLQKTAPIKFRRLKSSEQIEEVLPDFVRQQILRRELLAETSSCQRPEFTALLHALAQEHDLLEQLRFFVLEWEGRPLAYHLGFEANDKFTMYQQTFNVEAWDYSAGEVLMRQLFLYADTRVTREFDFSVGEEGYKSRFANHFKPNFTAYVEPPRFRGRLRRFQRKIQGRLVGPRAKLKRLIRDRSNVYRAAKYARTWSAESYALLRRRQEPETVIPVPASAEVQITEGRLTDLAELHLECPRFRLATRLATFKQRLKSGDKIYITRQNGRPALLAWARNPDSSVDGSRVYDQVFLDARHGKASSEALEAFVRNLK